jgi:hypothetical protein
MPRKPPFQKPTSLSSKSRDIADRPKIYQMLSELFASVGNRTERYHFRLLGTSDDSLSQLLDCDDETTKQILSLSGVFDLKNNKFKGIQDNFSAFGGQEIVKFELRLSSKSKADDNAIQIKRSLQLFVAIGSTTGNVKTP